MIRRTARYGLEAPGVLFGLAIGGLAGLVAAGLAISFGWWLLGLTLLVLGLVLVLHAVSFGYTTRRGRFSVWSQELDRLQLNGDELILDLGTSRGAVLVAAARRLPSGRVVGVDRWSLRDPSGATLSAVRRNLAIEGVNDQVTIVTGDPRSLPFVDGGFDVVLSGVSLHALEDEVERELAVGEALRVLKPGGTLRIADIHHASAYAHTLRELGAAEVRVRGLGWRYWYGSPGLATRMVSARKP